MKKFKVLTILLFALIIVNAIIDKSAILLPPNANFIEYFAKRVPVYCRIEPKDDIKDLPLINVGDVQIENLSSQADLSVITEYSGVSMLWLKKTAQNRHEANKMFLATILFVVVSVIIVAIINIYVLILACKVLWGFAKEKIFTFQQSKRIGRIVLLLILSDVIANIFTLSTHYYAASKLTFANWEFVMPNLYISGIITAIILWLFNEMLKHTILLKEEQSLTI
jgi:hypothetical protein